MGRCCIASTGGCRGFQSRVGGGKGKGFPRKGCRGINGDKMLYRGEKKVIGDRLGFDKGFMYGVDDGSSLAETISEEMSLISELCMHAGQICAARSSLVYRVSVRTKPSPFIIVPLGTLVSRCT